MNKHLYLEQILFLNENIKFKLVQILGKKRYE